MTVKNDIVLWDNGIDKLCLLTVPNEHQYKYIEGVSCITFGISYENMNFKGCDTFTLFDHFYSNIVNEIESTYTSLNGSFRIYDVGADTDGYIEFVMKNGDAISGAMNMENVLFWYGGITRIDHASCKKIKNIIRSKGV